jgi:membrane-associated phospholipid phosphatase
VSAPGKDRRCAVSGLYPSRFMVGWGWGGCCFAIMEGRITAGASWLLGSVGAILLIIAWRWFWGRYEFRRRPTPEQGDAT